MSNQIQILSSSCTAGLAIGRVLLGPFLLLTAIDGYAQENRDRLPQEPSATFEKAARVLELAIETGAFPGCAFAVGTRDQVLWKGGYGKFTYDDEVARELGLPGNPTPSPQTIYDLASLTKVVGTTSAILMLASDGKLRLDDPVANWIPEFAEGDDSERRKRVSIEHLLVHASGLPSWKPFYHEAKDYDTLLARVVMVPLEAAPGTRYRYSDLGFILLGEVAARAGGASLDEIEQRLIFQPLGMTSTTRRLSDAQRLSTPPTEFESETHQYVHGQVHDENSRITKGQTGHAGLFSHADDLSRFATEYLRALSGSGRVFPEPFAKEFTRRRRLIENSSRALGWDTPSRRSSGGQHISVEAFGHTGFTGTSMWVDRARGVYWILLTNRVHPTRDNRKITRVRREFADAVLTAFDRHEQPAPLECDP